MNGTDFQARYGPERPNGEIQARTRRGASIEAEIGIERARRRALDQDVRRRRQSLELAAAVRAVEVEHQRPLAGVEVSEQRAVLDAVGRLAPAQRIALGRLDLHHLGTQLGEQLGGVGAGRSAADLEHAKVVECAVDACGIRDAAPHSLTRPSGEWASCAPT